MSAGDPAIRPMEVAGNRLTLLPDGPERLEALIALIDGGDGIASRALLYLGRRRIRAAGARRAGRGGRAGRAGLAAGRRLRRGRGRLLPAAGRGRRRASAASCRAGGGAICCATTRSWRWPTGTRRSSAASTSRTIISARSRRAPGATSASRSRGRASPAWSTISRRSSPGPSSRTRSIRRLRRALYRSSVRDGAVHWLFGGPTRRLSPWARSVKNDLMHARRVDIISAYFAPSFSMLRRLFRVAERGRGTDRDAGEARSPIPDRGRPLLLLAPAEARRRDLRISGDQAAFEADRGRRRRPYRLGQFRPQEPLSEPRNDAADR